MSAAATGRAVLVGVAVAVLAAACGGTTQMAESAPPSSESSATQPSQTAADAARDGVIPEVAALPFSVRVDVRGQVVAAEGVWVLSVPTAAAAKNADGCRLGPDTGKYPTDTICVTEYGELLLLDAGRSRILRAYPLPAVPPTFLLLTPDAVYCGRAGDAAVGETMLPDSMVCRVDRATLAARVRVFPAPADSVVAQPCFFPPASWSVADRWIGAVGATLDGDRLLVRAGDGTTTALDATTLGLADRAAAG